LTDYVWHEPCRLRFGLSQYIGVESILALLCHFSSSYCGDTSLLEMEDASLSRRVYDWKDKAKDS
jgi:hypothetical protein